MKDERIAQMRELLGNPVPSDPTHLQQHVTLLRMYLEEATAELRDNQNREGGEFGRDLRARIEKRIQGSNTTENELPIDTEVVSLSLHFTSDGPVVDVRMKLVPYLEGSGI